MGRRRRSSTADDVIELASWLPWWAALGLAGLSYVVCGAFARPPAQPTPLAAVLVAAASVGQFLLPLIFALGAAASVWRRYERQALLATAAQTGKLDGMTWQQFERLVGAAFEQQGFTVVETGRAGADGGVDLVLTRGGEVHLVQCKQWRAQKVGVDVVRELYGVMAARGAAGGFVVTSGRFTDDAQAFAAGRNVRLIEGRALLRMIDQVMPASRVVPAANAGQVGGADLPGSTSPSVQDLCPRCSKPMVLRTARPGGRSGSSFWGCSTFPACKGTRPAP